MTDIITKNPLMEQYEDVWKRAADTDGGRDSVFLTPQNYFVGS